MTDILPFTAQPTVIPARIVSVTNFNADTIQFIPDQRFDDTSKINSIELANSAVRDLSKHVEINKNSFSPMNYGISMTSEIFSSRAIETTIDKEFTEF